MAEDLAKELLPEHIEAKSAGTDPTKVNPIAVKVMEEIGININDQKSETIEEYIDDAFDAAITLCDSANESCLIFPGAKRMLHQDFRDPISASKDK